MNHSASGLSNTSAGTQVRRDFNLVLDTGAVLRGQGIDPQQVSPRRRVLLDSARQALEIGLPLLSPAAVYRRVPAAGLAHNRLHLAGGDWLQGDLISSQLGGAREIFAAVCTVGDAIHQRARAELMDQPAFALALDGLASAAVEAVAALLCQEIDAAARQEGLEAGLPLSPGLDGWSVNEGQPQLFNLLDTRAIGVTLTEKSLMLPVKSASFVIGIGEHMQSSGQPCDLCALAGTCRYRGEYSANPTGDR